MNSPASLTDKTLLPASLGRLVSLVESEEAMTPRRARALILEAGLKPEDLQGWANFDHSAGDSYGRQQVFDGGHFEMMVMSWQPGDCSGIHDHGHTQWGAVQVFGPAEHAVFLVQDGEIKTLTRTKLKPGQVLAVGHELVHQMRNPSDSNFLTFHLYGTRDRRQNITGDARVFALEADVIQRTDGGVFYALPESKINSRESGPQPDFMTWIRHFTELLRRLVLIQNTDGEMPKRYNKGLELRDRLFDKSNWDWFEDDLMGHVDELTGHVEEMGYWKLLRTELNAAADIQKYLLHAAEDEDPFSTYAELYDDVIGKPCLEEFIAGYLRFFFRTYQVEPRESRLLSIGCGTGIVEQFLIDELGMPHDNLLGIDKSEPMVRVASRRIRAECKDLLDGADRSWDLTFCGLNVFQYLWPEQLERGIEMAAHLTRPGGYFIGDFITPDHIRIYPHVLRSRCGKVISLRQPVLIEQENSTFQQSEIINVNRKADKMIITYEGKHVRFLPSLWRLRRLFESTFGGEVDVYDAVTLKRIEGHADTCPSTRILIVARKNSI